MRTSATITFHACHNYGSMLQAYSLQQVIKSLGIENEIINLRTDAQRRMYTDPRRRSLKSRIGHLGLGMFFDRYAWQLARKYDLFEQFMAENLTLTPEVSDPRELTKRYDCYVTGSDQCWNTRCRDFNWAYYLDFTDSAQKISYSSSIGPFSHDIEAGRVREFVKDFKAISVRDSGTQRFITELTGQEPVILPDPALLPEISVWNNLIAPKPLIEHPYLFFYTPYRRDGMYDVAEHLSSSLNLPVVTSLLTDYRHEVSLRVKGHLTARLDVGPLEFLNLVKNADAVLSGSFHALLFALIFHVPVWAFDGDTDLRMNQILQNYGLSDRAISKKDVLEKAPHTMEIDYAAADAYIVAQRIKAFDYLRTNLIC